MALLPGPEAEEEEDAELIPARRVAVSEILPLTMVGNQVPTSPGLGYILIVNKLGNFDIMTEGPTVNILIFYCSSVVPLFQISVLSARSASSSSPPAAIWAGAGTSSSSVRWRLENEATYPSPRQTCELCLTLHI